MVWHDMVYIQTILAVNLLLYYFSETNDLYWVSVPLKKGGAVLPLPKEPPCDRLPEQ